jgi:dUTP pyrophosphatase
MNLRVKIKRINENAVIPQYAHDYDAGFDLVATKDVVVEPGETVKVPTGLAFELPPNYELQVRPRSGVTLKTKLRVQLGTVDAGYRGEVGVIVDNVKLLFSEDDELPGMRLIDGNFHDTPYRSFPRGTYLIRKGDRIAQAVIKPVEHAHFVEVDELSETARGTGGFGSSGVNS